MSRRAPSTPTGAQIDGSGVALTSNGIIVWFEADAGNRTYQVAVAPEAVALTQLLNTPGGKLMSPLADGRLECHHLLHIPECKCEEVVCLIDFTQVTGAHDTANLGSKFGLKLPPTSSNAQPVLLGIVITDVKLKKGQATNLLFG